ncbi:MAG TPA: AAA family ATPase [Caulobacteraceae bacterium]|jgi:chromosome partitioning protein|nr:AAA family ATPase [Caulobacteraceae bacterium]
MNIIAVVAQKGGTGKSTVVANLAVAAHLAGRRTIVVDTDPQGCIVNWSRARGAAEPTVIYGKAAAIHPMRFAAERAGLDLMLIDTRASSIADSLDAAKAAQLTLVVVRPTAIDLNAIRKTVEALKPLGRPATFVLNQAPSRRVEREPAIVGAAVDLLLGYGLPLTPVALRSRGVYQTAFAEGLSPLETEPEGLAARELQALWAHVSGRLPWARRPKPSPVLES